MRIEFDAAKDAFNLSKHDVSLALGAVVLANLIGEIEDDRLDYGEVRVNLRAGRRPAVHVHLYVAGGRAADHLREARQ